MCLREMIVRVAVDAGRERGGEKIVTRKSLTISRATLAHNQRRGLPPISPKAIA
jgi:hypothetical protein